MAGVKTTATDTRRMTVDIDADLYMALKYGCIHHHQTLIQAVSEWIARDYSDFVPARKDGRR